VGRAEGPKEMGGWDTKLRETRSDSTDECPDRARAYTVIAGKAGTGAYKVRCSRGRRS
jgi:hypothetical protein